MNPVMLAKKFESKRAKWPMWGSTKLDGIRGFFKGDHFVSRNGKEIRGLDHLVEALQNFNYTLDGELMIPDMHFQKASGLIRNYHQQPEVQYHVFDIPSTIDCFEDRQEFLALYIENLNHPKVHHLKHELLQTENQAMLLFAEEIRRGHEGLMLKSTGHLYRNARSYDWMKMKVQETADLGCIGFFEGEGRLTGTLGGIIVDYNGVKVRVGTGFSDAERHEIWGNALKYLDQIAEVAWHEETPDGSLRHPSFKTWRFDK